MSQKDIADWIIVGMGLFSFMSFLMVIVCGGITLFREWYKETFTEENR